MPARGKSRRRRKPPLGDFFIAALDFAVSDDASRLLLADSLAERGDWRAAGYRWLATQRKEPSRAASTWDWWHESSTNRREIVLPDAVWQLLPSPPVERFPNCKEFATLLAAEEAICTVILTLQSEGRCPQ